MKLFRYKDREQAKCPTKDSSCLGPQCSCFNPYYDWYDINIVLMDYEEPWWRHFRPFYFRRKLREQFELWEPPKLDGWEFFEKDFTIFTDVYPRARYRRLNEDRRFYCGLNCENN